MGEEVACDLCEALVFELHTEIHRHNILRKDGEEGILDSVEAVCLAVVQNYTLISISTETGDGYVERLKGQNSFGEEEDQLSPEGYASAFRLKEMCMHYADSVAFDLSPAMYGYIQKGELADEAVGRFCWKREEGSCSLFFHRDYSEKQAEKLPGSEPSQSSYNRSPGKLRALVRRQSKGGIEAPPDPVQTQEKGGEGSGERGRKKKKMKRKNVKKKKNKGKSKKKKKKMQAQGKRNSGKVPVSAQGVEDEDDTMEDFFKLIERNPQMQQMLREEYQDPTVSLPERDREDIREAVEALLCSICEASIEEIIVYLNAARSNRRAFEDEGLIANYVESGHCSVVQEPVGIGGDKIAARMARIAPSPPEPAVWMDMYHVTKKGEKEGASAGWELQRLEKPVRKRGKGLDRATVKSGHILRLACEESVATNADVVSERIFLLGKEWKKNCPISSSARSSPTSSSSLSGVCDLVSSAPRRICGAVLHQRSCEISAVRDKREKVVPTAVESPSSVNEYRGLKTEL
eukprot:jgi/Bigna1/131608/aug1.15_g6316